MLQQRLSINILSCVSRKHLASLKILRCRRESETGKHLPLLGVLVLCTRDQLQTGHGREWRHSWAFLYTFPHATEFLRLLLLLQHRARDAKCCHPCAASSLHIQGTNPYLVYLPGAVCVSPLCGLRDACQGHRASIHPCSFVDIQAQSRKPRAADVGTASSLEIGVPLEHGGAAHGTGREHFGHCPRSGAMPGRGFPQLHHNGGTTGSSGDKT